MKALISLENVSVGFPVAGAPPSPAQRGGSRSLMRHLAYRSQVTKRQSLVLRNVWLNVNQGERLAVLGPNGSGKSTLLRVMAGAIPHQNGRITQFGDVAAILSAQTGFMNTATGYENIFLRGLVLGLSREQIEARIDEIIRFAALGDWLYRPVSNYSSGMTLRLAFAISTTVAADIIIMDEWIGAGDSRFLAAAGERLRNVVSSSSILVLASHNARIVRELCTRAIVLHEGSIVFRGPVPDALAFYDEFSSLLRAG